MSLRFAAVVIVVLFLGVPSLESIGARAQRQATPAQCRTACAAAERVDDSVISRYINQGISLCDCSCPNGGGIIDAATRGNCGNCIALLTTNPSNCPCDGGVGDSPIHIAAGNCNIPITNRLITAGCNETAVNSAGNTPLCLASRRLNDGNCGAVVQDLLGAGAEPCLDCSDGQTACEGCMNQNTRNRLNALGACSC